MVSGNSIDVDYHSDANAVNAEIKYLPFDLDSLWTRKFSSSKGTPTHK